MAAIYHYNTSDQEIFRAGINVLTNVKVPFLDTLLAPGNLALITELGIQNNETVQFFLTFDDAINWFYFGKGMGSINIRGMLLTCDSGTPGLPVLLDDVMRKMRGKSVDVSLGNAVFRCIMTSFNLMLTQDPAPVVEFTLGLNIYSHNLPTREKANVACDYNPRFDELGL
jgi:hypothetical protein